MTGRRLIVLLVVLAAVGAPAVALRAACVGRTCSSTDTGSVRIPFCPLPGALKADLAAGYYDERSPDVLAVTARPGVLGGSDPADAGVPWPALGSSGTTGVPIVFSGTGVDPSARVPRGTGLDQVAPTISEAIGLHRPYPWVRAGVAILGIPSGARPRLVLEVALRGVGTDEVVEGRWPVLRSLMHDGTGTLAGTTGSLPVDPAAMLTTIGTGGLPYQHGITGTFVRNGGGAVVRVWGRGAPPSVIATLPDDLDFSTNHRARIGLVASDPSDRGLIGMDWYPGHGTPSIVVARPGRAVDAAGSMLASGFGRDDVTDLLGVVLPADPGVDGELGRVVADAERASGGSVLVVVAGTGSSDADAGRHSDVPASELISEVEGAAGSDRRLISAAVPGGLFLDQHTLASEGITGQAAVDALLHVTTADGRPMMADAFQGFAVSFARYC